MLLTDLSFGSAVAIPYTIIGLSVPKESVGVSLGAMNITIELGGEFGLLVFELGFVATSQKRWQTIGAAAVAAIGAAVSSFFLIVPEQMDSAVAGEIRP
jgi:hypothetical protein